MLSTRDDALELDGLSSSETSFASIGLKPPRKIETPACSTSKVALEWATSTFQVPAGASRSVVASWSSEASLLM